MKDAELKSEYEDRYKIAFSGWKDFLEEAQQDMQFTLLAQYTEAEWQKAVRQGRTLYTFDKTQRQVHLLEGYEQRNRHILKIGPQEGSDNAACTQFTTLMMLLMAGGRGYTGYDIMSAAFKWGSLATGSNLVEWWRDREGDLRLHRWGFNSFMLDPSLTQPDLSDCGFILKGQWIPSDRVKFIMPLNAEKIDSIPAMKSPIRWPYLPNPLYYEEMDLRLYEEWWRRELTYVETVKNRLTEEEIPFKSFVEYFGDNKMARDWLKDQRSPAGGPLLTKYSKPIQRMKLTIFVGTEPVWDGYNPLGFDDYNFVWFHGEWMPECGRPELKLQPFVRGLRDPQRVFNHQINQAVDIIESQIQSGKIVRSKHLDNPEGAYLSGQGVVLHVKDDVPDSTPLGEIVKNLESSDIRPGLFNVLDLVTRSLVDVKGLNNEIFGSDDKDIPGILHKFRTGAALTGQQGTFAGLRAAKRLLGAKGVRLIQLNYNPYKVRRLLNQFPAQGFYEPDFHRYDCTPTEGLLTDTQNQLAYLELVNLRQMFPDFAQVITPSMLLEYMPIQAKEKLLQAVKMAEQRMQQVQQAQIENQQRINRLVEAQTAADVARAKEDISDIRENRANTALLQAKTLVEMRKLQGDTAQSQRDSDWQKQMDILDRKLEYEKIKRMNKGKGK